MLTANPGVLVEVNSVSVGEREKKNEKKIKQAAAEASNGRRLGRLKGTTATARKARRVRTRRPLGTPKERLTTNTKEGGDGK